MQVQQHLAALIREAAAAATVALEVLLAEAEAVDKVRKLAAVDKQREHQTRAVVVAVGKAAGQQALTVEEEL